MSGARKLVVNNKVGLMAGPKFWATVLLAFISLSGAAGERRCYWCGPLAEQVHRSRRSAACLGADAIAACERGYEYCAVVATSPPRVESRFCVKVYQDECYPLYCNSTNTWKMTCPCRGDLCNGPNTDREKEAFALLPKLVAKTHNARIKKRTVFPSPHLIKDKRLIDNSDSNYQNDPNKLIVNEDENPGKPSNNMESDQPNIIEHRQENNTQSVANQDAQTTTSINQLIEIQIHVSDPTAGSDKVNDAEHACVNSPSTTHYEEVRITETAKHENVPVMTTANTGENNEAPLKPTDNNVVAKTEEPIKTTDATKQDALSVEITKEPHSEPPMKTKEITQKEEPSKSLPPEDEMQNDATIINPTNVQLMGPTEAVMVEVPPNKYNVKPSEGVPTEEAQQHVSSAPVTEKSIQATTTEATTLTTATTQQNIVKIMTTPVPKRKNSAVKITFSFSLLLCNIVHL